MDTILIVGTETVAGANIAACLSDNHQAIGLSTANPGDLSSETARKWLNAVRPDRVVLCGNAARSNWELTDGPAVNAEDVAVARTWASAIDEFGCDLTLISSDAVFTGPWMFHDEDSSRECPSEPATRIRDIEKAALEACPNALIVRTNTFGWSSTANGPGWLESVLASLETGTVKPFDYLRHATPILATDLAKIVDMAHREGLSGFYHIAGAERVSPATFVERLAESFELPSPPIAEQEVVASRPTGFGCGETSLLTKKIRKRLGVSSPMLNEGLAGLVEQKRGGFCEKLADATMPSAHERVA